MPPEGSREALTSFKGFFEALKRLSEVSSKAFFEQRTEQRATDVALGPRGPALRVPWPWPQAPQHLPSLSLSFLCAFVWRLPVSKFLGIFELIDGLLVED